MKGGQRRSRKVWIRRGLCALDPRADVHEPASHVAVAALDRCFLDRLCATGKTNSAFGRDDANRRTAGLAHQRGSIAIRNKATSAISVASAAIISIC